MQHKTKFSHLPIWLGVCIILLTTVADGYYAGQLTGAVRFGAWIAAITSSAAIFLLSDAGRHFLSYIKEVASELRRVTWPTSTEVWQSGIVIFIVVILVGLLLWLLDSIFSWFVFSVV